MVEATNRMDDGDGLVKLRALWGYRRGRLDFLIVLLHAAQVCVVFVHVRVAVCRALLTMASVMWRTQCAAERRAEDPRRARDASVRCQVAWAAVNIPSPVRAKLASRRAFRRTHGSRVPVERNFLRLNIVYR